ncbi:MAG: hypothetical protein K2X38_02190 [Gemmataceae bacterium]|nr:hypothetical protein [Gemmataceae bacterium]
MRQIVICWARNGDVVKTDTWTEKPIPANDIAAFADEIRDYLTTDFSDED